MSNKAIQTELLLSGLIDTNGNPLSGGLVYTYAAGTTTNKITWTDREKTIPAANPVVLDSNGKAQIYADGIYKFVIKTSTGITLYTYDNLAFGLQDGPWVDVAEYASLTAAVAAIGSTETDLLIDSTTTCTANTTVPTNIRLKVTRKGRINQGSYTLAINGPFDASVSLIFLGSGAISGLSVAYPEWFGENSTPGTTDMSSAIQRAVESTNYTELRLSATTYRVLTPIQINNQTDTSARRTGIKIRGAGIISTIILNHSSDYAIKHTATSAQVAASPASKTYGVIIEDMTIKGDGSTPSGGAGIKLESTFLALLQRLYITTLKYGVGVHINASLDPNSDHYAVSFLQVKDCLLYDHSDWGYYHDNPSSDVHFERGMVVANRIGGVRIGGHDNSMIGTSIAGNGNSVAGIGGIYIYDANTTPHNNYFRNLEIDNNYVRQVSIQGYHHIMENCRLIQNGDGGFKATTAIDIGPVDSGYPQQNRFSNLLFRFDNPGSNPIAAFLINDMANGTGNVIENTLYSSTWAQLTKYSFTGTTRKGNHAKESKRMAYQAIQEPVREDAIATVYFPNSMLLTTTSDTLLTPFIALHDRGSDFSTNTYTVPYKGVLRITANLLTRGDTTPAVPYRFKIYKNGAASGFVHEVRGGISSVGTPGTPNNFSAEFLVVAGDTFKLYAQADTASTVYVIGDDYCTVRFEML